MNRFIRSTTRTIINLNNRRFLGVEVGDKVPISFMKGKLIIDYQLLCIFMLHFNLSDQMCQLPLFKKKVTILLGYLNSLKRYLRIHTSILS